LYLLGSYYSRYQQLNVVKRRDSNVKKEKQRGNKVSTSSSSRVTITNLRRTFGDVVALDSFSLDIKPGELVTLLGPSGCGKTTALRMVAGLDVPDSGIIEINGAAINDLPPSKRNMGMVFQAYSLFPNMTAIENVEFGLRVRGIDKAKRRKRAEEMIELVDLGKQSNRFPNQMSGGQQQRVALARALAIEPNVLLLDEPLSALDAKVRTHLRDQIRRVQQEVGITTLFVTHDQEEAMAISDRVGVMNKGNLEQLDKPDALYTNPTSAFVATFVGAMNRVPGKVLDTGNVEVLGKKISVANAGHGLSAGSTVNVMIRPEQFAITSGDSATITERSFRGPMTRIVVELSDGTKVDLDIASAETAAMNPGNRTGLTVNATSAIIEAR
jgi:putative spermidine/putrescine transport system ATP-binding protein